MNIDNYFKSRLLFSIPIYIRTQDDWHKDYKKKENKFISDKKLFYKENKIEFSQKDIITWEIKFNEQSAIWRYNEIIGFLEIKYSDNKLFSYLFKIDAKRFSPNLSKKRFYMDDISLPEYNISSSVLNEVKKYISKSISFIKSTYPKFLKYYYDTGNIENLISLFK